MTGDATDHRPPHGRNRLALGPLAIDSITLEEALDAVEEALVNAGRGGAVFTPNVDHVVLAEEDARMRRAYARADLSLVDGIPLLWASRLLSPLPEEISGSDFRGASCSSVLPREGGASTSSGAGPGVAEKARDRLAELLPGLNVVGVDAPRVGTEDSAERVEEVLAPVRRVEPQIVLVALGAPKQEIWIDQVRDALRPAVLLGIGASLDFVAGTIPRAPRWMSRTGLEWLFRLTREPGRLWRRYLLRDPRFLLVLAREMTGRRAGREG